jgi:hypothetical protein
MMINRLALLLVLFQLIAPAEANDQSSDYNELMNECVKGDNGNTAKVQYCNCATSQILNRKADLYYTMQYCGKLIFGVDVTQEELRKEIEGSGLAEKSIAECVTEFLKDTSLPSSLARPICTCMANRFQYEGISLEKTIRTCAAQFGIQP